MDLIVRQAVEAGVAAIVPVASERSLPCGGEDGRLARWRRIAREALEQCGAERLPRIEEPLRLAEAARRYGGLPGCAALFFHERSEGAEPLHELLAGAVGAIVVLVGPEGGLSEAEAGALARCGFRQAWLGTTVLRTETAALYAVAAVRTILGERDSWTPKRGG